MNYDQFIAALCIWREARGASMPAKAGVWHVIQNRASDAAHRWPKTLAGVVLQPFQFSSFNHNDPNAVRLPVPDSSEWPAWLDCCAVVGATLDPDPTGGANMYHSFSAEAQYPAWADASKLTATIGPFKFYKL